MTLALLLVLAVLAGVPAPARAAEDVDRLEGIVTSVRGATVGLSLRASDGLLAGDEGTISVEERQPDGRSRTINVARIRVTSVRPEGADATVLRAVERVQPGQRATFLYRARAAQGCVGEVVVTTRPAGASVTVDGAPVDGATPLTVRALTCGHHEIVATLPGHEDARQVVTISRTRPESVTFKLAAARATPPGETAAVRPDVTAPAPPPATAAPPAAPAPPGETVDVVVSTLGYTSVGAVQGVLTLGLLTSQYAIEIDDRAVLGWAIRRAETTVPLTPGRHRLRVLVRNVVSRAPVTLHEGDLEVKPGVANEARINFLISVVTVNGDTRAFNRLPPR